MGRAGKVNFVEKCKLCGRQNTLGKLSTVDVIIVVNFIY